MSLPNEIDDVVVEEFDDPEGAEGADASGSEVEVLRAQLALANQQLVELRGKEDDVDDDADVDDPPTPEPKDDDAPSLPPAEELEMMSNADLAKSIIDVVSHQVMQSLQKSPLMEKVNSIEGQLSEGRKERLTAEVSRLLEKYPDLMEYKKDIIAGAAKGLKVEEAYIVSRLRKGKGLPEPVKPTMPTERPTNMTVRRPKKAKPARTGPRGFSADLAEVLDNINIGGILEE